MKVKAFITAAGVGRRFGALTRQTNKCLLHVEGKPLLTHILDKLEAAGIRETVLVTGYQNRAVRKCAGRRARAIFNPFYRVSGILASFWAARSELDGKAFLFTTSDHFFHPSVLRSCLRPVPSIRIVVQKKKRYTREDAKVTIQGLNVLDLAKSIPVSEAHGEFAGMAYFSARASARFFEELHSHFENGDLGGYMMDIMKRVRQKHAMPIRYAACAEDTRIEVDSVHDLIEARTLARNFKRKKIRRAS